MLQSMRHMAQSWVFKGLMMILIVSFGIWGVGDVFKGNPLERSVAKVGGETITVQELSQEFDRSLAQVRQSLGPDFTAQQAKQMGLLDMTLNNLIARIQVAQEVNKLGIHISPRTMLNVFASIPDFQRDGKFDKELMRQKLGQSNLNERQFVEKERDDLERHTLIDIFVDKDPVPQTILDELYHARAQKRILDVITLENDSVGNVATPDDKTLNDFYGQNPKLFTAPEYRGITIARLSTDDLAKDVTVTDEQVQKEYDVKSAQLDHPERRDIVQVVLQDEAKAKKLSTEAKSSGNLTASAKSAGYEAIDLGESDKTSLLPEIADPVFALKQEQVSDPIKSSLGWHVMQVSKIIPAGKPSFAEMKDELRKSLQRDQAIDSATKLVNQLDDELAAGHPLDDIADSMKLRLIKIPAVDSNGKTPDGKDPSELPFKADVLKTAFSQNSGESSPVLDDRNGNYFVVRTDEVTPSAVKPFDKIKNDVVTAWKAQEQAKQAKVEADKIAQGLREGKAASSFADKEGIDVRVSKPISQVGDNDPLLPQGLVPQILKLKKGEVLVVPTPDHQLILRLANIVEADDKNSAVGMGRVKQEIDEDMPKEMTSEYIKYLRVIFPVEIHQDALDVIAQQGG